jgi:hypothetical protein
VHLHDRELSMRASIGIPSGKTTEEGARGSPANADVAMYMAKGASIRARHARSEETACGSRGDQCCRRYGLKGLSLFINHFHWRCLPSPVLVEVHGVQIRDEYRSPSYEVSSERPTHRT